MDKPSIGRFVHYTLADGQCRPAVIVCVFSEEDPGTSNLVVFVDGGNDNRQHEGQFLVPEASAERLTVWKTSVTRSEAAEPHKWHWPERV